MKLGYTILYVADVPATLAFWCKAFGLSERMRHEDLYGELETGATRLGFSQRGFVQGMLPVPLAEGGPDLPPPPFEIGLVSDDPQAAWDRAVRAGAVPVKAPETKPWGQVVGYVRDCNGVLVEICSAMP